MTAALAAAELAPEDAGRLNLYALLARLLYAGPDEALLQALAGASDLDSGDGPLAQTWRALRAAAASADAATETVAFDTTFVGVGKAPVTTYLSHYMVTVGQERILVALRDTLRELGLARGSRSVEPEDNIAAVLEVMRHLVAQGSDASSLQRQESFFREYLQPGYHGFCNATRELPATPFHVAVVDLLEVFLDAEAAQFEMH
jgi:TorA maturation chaperone TorD